MKLWELKLKWDEDSAGLRQEDKAGLRMYYCPTEPDQYGYKDFIAYAGDKLAILKHRDDERTPELSGKKFLPQDENISVLLDVAGAHFAIGASLAMADLPQ